MPQRSVPAVAVLVLHGTDFAVLYDPDEGVRVVPIAEEGAVRSGADVDGSVPRGPLVDLLLTGDAWLRPVLPEDIVRHDSAAPPSDEREDADDHVAARRLAACRMCDAAGVRMGCKAIGRFLHASWTEEVARTYGPMPKPRSVRLWRKSRGTCGNRALEQMRSRYGTGRGRD